MTFFFVTGIGENINTAFSKGISLCYLAIKVYAAPHFFSFGYNREGFSVYYLLFVRYWGNYPLLPVPEIQQGLLDTDSKKNLLDCPTFLYINLI